MSEPTLPTEAELAESRERNNVPASWVWRLCSNPTCSGFVWIDPAMLADPHAFPPCCSEACVRACLEAQLRAGAP
jgi:hypothetical protein